MLGTGKVLRIPSWSSYALPEDHCWKRDVDHHPLPVGLNESKIHLVLLRGSSEDLVIPTVTFFAEMKHFFYHGVVSWKERPFPSHSLMQKSFLQCQSKQMQLLHIQTDHSGSVSSHIVVPQPCSCHCSEVEA